jgi:TolB-like protein
MPFVEGESLRDRMKREHMLPLYDAQQIAYEVSDALNYAHKQGLVHRDIKPDNIMLAGKHALIMDFGIARAVEAAGGDKLTQTGMAVGTPLYMSPEQATAADDVDGRSDIYSLGCVLYEMVAATPPFTGPSNQAVIARHVADHVPSPTIIRETISPELEDIIMCSLAKAPADRFNTAGELSEALHVSLTGTGVMPRMSLVTRAGIPSVSLPAQKPPSIGMRRIPQFAAAYGATSWVVLEVLDQLIGNEILPQLFYQLALTLVLTLAPGLLVVAWFHGEKGVQKAPLIEKWLLAGVGVLALGAASVVYRGAAAVLPENTGPPLSRVAVLYLEDRSPNQEFQHVADGLTEGIIRSLAQVSALDVVSRNGVAPFRDLDISRDSIARALQVGSLIVGSVEAIGDRLRISAELVDGGSGAPIDRVSFELPVASLVQAQDSVVQEVSRLLRTWIGAEVRVQAQRRETSSDIAWALVRRGELARRQADELALHDDLGGAYGAYLRADSLFQQAEVGDDAWVEPVLLRADVAYTACFGLSMSPGTHWLTPRRMQSVRWPWIRTIRKPTCFGGSRDIRSGFSDSRTTRPNPIDFSRTLVVTWNSRSTRMLR